MPSERPVIVITPKQRDDFFKKFNANYGEDISVIDFIHLFIHLEEKKSILSRRRKILCDKLMNTDFNAKTMLETLQNYLTGSQDVQEFFMYMKEKKGKIIKEIENSMPDSNKSTSETNPPENIHDSLYYESITNELRGHVLIVNYRSHRDGSEKDVPRLEEVFGKLKYKIQTEYDLKKVDLLSKIKDFANKEEHADCHAAGLIIMGHGQDGAIKIDEDGGYCQDPKCRKKQNENSTCVKKQAAVEIMQILTEFNSDKLKDKPTFVIFQVCRPPFIMDGNKTSISGSTKDKGNNLVYSVENLHPTFPNCAILFTCRPTFLSDRHPQKGAYFIQAICDILQVKGETMSLDQLFPAIALENRTMNIVENANSETIVPEMVTTMNKKFRF